MKRIKNTFLFLMLVLGIFHITGCDTSDSSDNGGGSSTASYMVSHLTENLDGSYSVYTSVLGTGSIGSTITANPTALAGFTYDDSKTENVTISADGTSILCLYYSRNTIEITLDLNGGTLDGSSENVTLSGKYGAKVDAVSNPEKTEYEFSGWNTNGGILPETYPVTDATYTAVWNTGKLNITVY